MNRADVAGRFDLTGHRHLASIIVEQTTAILPSSACIADGAPLFGAEPYLVERPTVAALVSWYERPAFDDDRFDVAHQNLQLRLQGGEEIPEGGGDEDGEHVVEGDRCDRGRMLGGGERRPLELKCSQHCGRRRAWNPANRW